MKALERAKADLFWWLENWAFTKDEHDQSVVAKRFPRYSEAPWIYKFLELLLSERRLSVAKSRQMMMSWASVLFFLWDTQFKPNVNTFFLSENQMKANKLVARAKFTYLHQPCPPEILDEVHTVMWRHGDVGTASCLPFGPPKRDLLISGATYVQSKIEGLPQGGDAIRSETATNVFFDEVARQELAESDYQALVPTIDRYGRILMVSTPNGKEFFYRIIYDLKDEEAA